MKRIIALALALIMVLSMGSATFAADSVVLPDGITEADFTDGMTVTDGVNYYATLQAAVEAIATAGTAGANLYCKPGADVGSLQHAPVINTLTVYGNGAEVTGGNERDFDIGNTDPSGGKDITANMTLTVYDLDGCGAWGAKATEHTVNLVFENCQNMGKVFLTGAVGTLNITMTDCSFEGVLSEAVYSNADGRIELTRVDFSNLNKAINQNHKSAGTQTIVLTDCTFTDCGANVSSDQIPVRVLTSVEGGSSILTVENCTFSGTLEGGADILLDYGVGRVDATVSGTSANVCLETASNVGETTAVSSSDSVTFRNYAPAAKIGTIEYGTLQDAVNAVQNGDTIIILDDITIKQAGATNNNAVYYTGDKSFTIDFNGKTVTGDTSNVVFRFQKAENGAQNSITFKNGKIVSTANSWSAVSIGSSADTKTYVNLIDMSFEANKGGDFAVRARAGAIFTLTDCTINTKYAGGVVAGGGEVELNNVTVDQQGMHTAPYNSVAVSVNGKGKVTINSGSYSTKILAPTDGNNQGASHGSWCLGIMNSGGTMIINDGIFSNGVHESTTANTYYRALIDTDDYANLQIKGGTFTAIKDIISNSSLPAETPADGAAVIAITGGSFSASFDSNYISKGYQLNGTSAPYTVDLIIDNSKEEVLIPEDAAITTEKETINGDKIVSASTTVSSSIVETLVENNQGIVVEAPVDSAVNEVTDSVVVSFDAEATETLSEMADDIKIVIEATTHEAALEEGIITPAQHAVIEDKEVDVAVVLTADIFVNGVEQDFVTNGGVEIEIPFAPAVGTELTDYVVYFLNDNGTLAKVPTQYVNGNLVVTLQHFSTYLIGTQPVCDCALASKHVVPGDVLNLPNPIDKNYKVSYDFTTGTKGYSGASLVDSVKWNKSAGAWQLILKDRYSMAEERTLKGLITFTGTGVNKGQTKTVEINETVCNHIQYIWGESRIKDVTTTLDTSVAPLIIMDEDGGYVKFQEEMLSGIVKMNKDEKTFLNLIYGANTKTEETIDAIEEYLGEDYVEEAIAEYYTFETRAFKNDVDFSYEAYEDDPHYFYLWKDGELTKIDAKYNDDEEVEAWQWTAVAEGTIIVTDVEIVLTAETTKNPNTGASNAASMASALAVVSLVAAGAITIKK